MRRTTVLLLAATLAGSGARPARGDDDRKTLTLDVAWDCRTFNYMRGLTLEQVVRGDVFMMNGKVFPAGTLRPGTQSNDPNAAGSIGSWAARGTSTGSLAEHIANPTLPAIYWTQFLSLSTGMIVTEGWFAPAGANDSAVVGGTKAFRGVSGDLTIESLGTNATGCDNTRYRIVVAKKE
jgi:hypothetical protein